MLTQNLLVKVDEVGGDEITPVVIFGNGTPTYNSSMVRWETLGWSFYEWDAEIMGGTGNSILNYWRTQGFKYTTPANE